MCRYGTDAVEMHHLASGMHTGVGATRCKGSDRPVGIQLGDGCFEFGLHAVAVALTLPPTKSGTLVLQAEGDPMKDRRFRNCRRGLGAQTSVLT